eukprot:TRINITY_DN6766_c1_g3_i1.p1 TRINITY_DN6766_c1_g3~~TRINITY_DN6766_c1_g3_i1.p1  ORF type:complete len:496 (-),score=161.94 TRINITY_DN6766_c1_g3_i1:1134-2591(-)
MRRFIKWWNKPGVFSQLRDIYIDVKSQKDKDFKDKMKMVMEIQEKGIKQLEDSIESLKEHETTESMLKDLGSQFQKEKTEITLEKKEMYFNEAKSILNDEKLLKNLSEEEIQTLKQFSDHQEEYQKHLKKMDGDMVNALDESTKIIEEIQNMDFEKLHEERTEIGKNISDDDFKNDIKHLKERIGNVKLIGQSAFDMVFKKGIKDIEKLAERLQNNNKFLINKPSQIHNLKGIIRKMTEHLDEIEASQTKNMGNNEFDNLTQKDNEFIKGFTDVVKNDAKENKNETNHEFVEEDKVDKDSILSKRPYFPPNSLFSDLPPPPSSVEPNSDTVTVENYDPNDINIILSPTSLSEDYERSQSEPNEEIQHNQQQQQQQQQQKQEDPIEIEEKEVENELSIEEQLEAIKGLGFVFKEMLSPKNNALPEEIKVKYKNLDRILLSLNFKQLSILNEELTKRTTGLKDIGITDYFQIIGDILIVDNFLKLKK